jgi:transposase, IS6 family
MIGDRPVLFRGRHFADEVIVLCVRWYLRYSLSYRDVAELVAERHLSVDSSTIWRWVQRYAPELNARIVSFRQGCASWRTTHLLGLIRH